MSIKTAISFIEKHKKSFVLLSLIIHMTALFIVSVFSFENGSNKISISFENKKVISNVCYVTTYGEKYHSSDCQYLHNSSYKTTVYDAIREGYSYCSKCDVSETTRIYTADEQYDNDSTSIKWVVCIPLILIVFIFLRNSMRYMDRNTFRKISMKFEIVFFVLFFVLLSGALIALKVKSSNSIYAIKTIYGFSHICISCLWFFGLSAFFTLKASDLYRFSVSGFIENISGKFLRLFAITALLFILSSVFCIHKWY